NTMPWEIFSAIEQAVIDGKVSLSRSGAASKNVNWVSLIIPNDARVIQSYLDEFKSNEYIPASLKSMETNYEYFEKRYTASSKWIEEKNHAVISNGPFYLESYSPESRTISVSAFNDESYPFRAGYWSEFENTEFPKITKVQIPNLVQKNSVLAIEVDTIQTDSVLYFLNNNRGERVSSEVIMVEENSASITIPEKLTKELEVGANDVKIFAISKSVLKPDYYSSSFLVTEEPNQLPEITQDKLNLIEEEEIILWILLPIIVIIIGIFIYLKRR
ncbi:MAG: ABC transporter substrate-binding protein, partial [Candidatus Nitrosomaritimum aestuariumsis]